MAGVAAVGEVRHAVAVGLACWHEHHTLAAAFVQQVLWKVQLLLQPAAAAQKAAAAAAKQQWARLSNHHQD
jgi:hypothetical protein